MNTSSIYPYLNLSRNTSSSGLPRKCYSTPSDLIGDLIGKTSVAKSKRAYSLGLESGSERLTLEEWKALKKAVLDHKQ